MELLSNPNPDAELLEKIEAFIVRTGMKPSRFGREAMNDGDLIRQLREGRSLSLKNAKKVIDFMADCDELLEELNAPGHCDLCGPRSQGEIDACTRVKCPSRQAERRAA